MPAALDRFLVKAGVLEGASRLPILPQLLGLLLQVRCGKGRGRDLHEVLRLPAGKCGQYECLGRASGGSAAEVPRPLDCLAKRTDGGLPNPV